LMGPDGKGDLAEKIRGLADKYGISSNDIKNLTVSAALIKLQQAAGGQGNEEDAGFINSLFGMAKNLGISNKKLI
ncbi:MAG: flotillin family protein, partial [Myroides sp.]